MLGVDAETVKRAAHAHRVMESQEAEPFNRELCKIAAAAFESDNAGHTVGGQLFQKLATADKWYPEFNKFTDSVKCALAKSAAALPAFLASKDAIGGPTQSLLALGALGGLGVGSLGFLLSRHASQSSAENAALLEKIKAFKQLRQDIEEDMHAKSVLEAQEAKKPRTRYDV
jgi:hypothetical protein